MIATLGIMLAGLLLVLGSGAACDDTHASDDSGLFDALLFLLVLIGVVAQHRRKQADEF